MKKFLILFTLLIISARAFSASMFDYNVDVQDTSKEFVLKIITNEDRSSMGRLVATNLCMKMPKNHLPGLISMNLELDPNAAHLPAFGPQEGELVFQKGRFLPSLMDGEYLLEIDDVSYGSLLFEDGKVYYYQLEIKS